MEQQQQPGLIPLGESRKIKITKGVNFRMKLTWEEDLE